NPDDPVAFRKQVKYICSLHLKAKELLDKGIHLVSTDEKTGIQALERACPAQPMKLGRVERIEARIYSSWSCSADCQLAYC
ncbi:MAG TPA: hypothetical protein V6C91_12700, partial [Coleofasciculaceae cyanobacterium]